MATLAVAQTILSQLGGKKFLVMTGAKSLYGGPDMLQFSLPASLTTGHINKCRISLNALDLYDIECWRIVKFEIKAQVRENNIYAEDLQRIFTAMTGLDTHL